MHDGVSGGGGTWRSEQQAVHSLASGVWAQACVQGDPVKERILAQACLGCQHPPEVSRHGFIRNEGEARAGQSSSRRHNHGLACSQYRSHVIWLPTLPTQVRARRHGQLQAPQRGPRAQRSLVDHRPTALTTPSAACHAPPTSPAPRAPWQPAPRAPPALPTRKAEQAVAASRRVTQVLSLECAQHSVGARAHQGEHGRLAGHILQADLRARGSDGQAGRRRLWWERGRRRSGHKGQWVWGREAR